MPDSTSASAQPPETLALSAGLHSLASGIRALFAPLGLIINGMQGM